MQSHSCTCCGIDAFQPASLFVFLFATLFWVSMHLCDMHSSLCSMWICAACWDSVLFTRACLLGIWPARRHCNELQLHCSVSSLSWGQGCAALSVLHWVFVHGACTRACGVCTDTLGELQDTRAGMARLGEVRTFCHTACRCATCTSQVIVGRH